MNIDQPDPISDLGDDLVITKTTRRAAGAGIWVIGAIADHQFHALVFPAHAECPNYELDDSRISKLWVQRIEDQATVANFDRGWDILPTTVIAQVIVDFLALGLAVHIYGK